MTSELYEKRKELFLKACNHIETEHVPNLMYGFNALLDYAGMTYWDVEKDETKYKKSIENLVDKAYFDVTVTFYSGNPRAHEALDGRTETFLASNGITPQHVQLDKMKEDEYPQLIANPFKFINEVLIPRKYPSLFNGDKRAAMSSLKIVVEEMIQNNITGPLGKNTKYLEEDFELPVVGDLQLLLQNPLDLIFDAFRGFTGTQTDLRRHKHEIKDACDVLWNTMCNHFDDLSSTFPFVFHAPHIPAYLSPKQFYELYWPYEKELFTNIHRNEGKVFMSSEGRWAHIMECFQDLPKDSAVIAVDEDDIVDVKMEVGNYQTICGGVRLQDIHLSSTEKCIDYAKRAIDECAPGGGFVFSSDRAWICPGDINQKLIDVFNFAHDYSKNK